MMKRLFLIIWVASVFLTRGQTTFQNLYGTPALEGGQSVQQTSDGGYILAGTSNISGNLYDLYLVKTNSFGIILWTKTYGGPNFETGLYAQQTNDGGYIVLGYTQTSPGYYDIYVVKTDASGNMLWSKTYGGSGREIGYRIKQTTDGGYFICGWSDSYGPRAAYLIKTDASGNITWTKAYRGKRYATGYCAEQTSDGGYILTGQIVDSVASSFVYDVLLVKTNSIGDTLWTKTFGGTNTEEPYSVKQTSDGGYVITGRTYSYGAGLTDVFLTKTDANGNLMWSKTYGGTNSDLASDVEQTTDGGFIVAGWTESFGYGNTNCYLIKTNSIGDTLWTRTYGRTGGDFAYSVKQTTDGGYVIGGEGYDLANPGDSYVYAVKTDVNGIGGCNKKNTNSLVTSPVMVISNLPVILYTGGVTNNPTTLVGSAGTSTTLCSNVGIKISNEIINNGLYPNPNNGVFKLQIDNEIKNGKFCLFNALGQKIHEQSIIQGTNEIYLNRISSGFYNYVLMENNLQGFTGKLVIE